MRSDTVAVHGGYETEPTTRAVAVPIYQTVAYEFDSADHGAALFNLEAEGHRYSRISNPTTAVLERRVAALEGGVEALCVSSGQAALNYAVLNLASMGSNIVSLPLARKYLGGRACSLFTFGIVGGLETGKRFYDALKLIKRLVNMGDAKSLACHPASTTHRQMSVEEQEKAGIRPETIRLSIGIEHIDDILADLDQALAAAQTRRASPLIAAE